MSDPSPRDVTLAFDTSGPACCAAILLGDAVVVERVEHMARGQAERLIPLLEELFGTAGLVWADVTRIGVGIGPGNFTGIRISVAAARGLALSLDCPAIGVSTLDALADGQPRPCVTVVPARRGAIYLQVHEGGLAQPPRALPLDDLSTADLPFGTPVCGEGVDDVAALTGAAVLPECVPRAVAIARIARARAGHHADRPRPLYLRAADAAPASDLPPTILSR